ncbi:MAG: hypothetical protein IJ638_02965 [Alphaproteobacteria bacterium]|nr:hypothetical protein [Alphaproteobacteria bacterium]
MKKVSLLVLSLLLMASDGQSATKKSLRKAGGKAGGRRNASKSNNTKSITKKDDAKNTEVKSLEQKVEEKKSSTEKLNSSLCDSEYTRCMNKICASDTLGKCICYEDRSSANSLSTNFIDIDGMKVKKGFEAFEYAKKSCTEILDKCMDSRRLITEKYKNLVQRDCLMLSKEEVSASKGISGDLQKLKACVKDACTVKGIEGYENFTFPEYSLCYNEDYAKFSIDAFCSDIISKSASPLGTKQMFLDEMALKREQSCKSMGGTLSNDRKKCYVMVEYGKNKDLIKATKRATVGEYVECSASSFGTKQGESWEKRQKDMNRIMSMGATAFNAAGAVLGMAGIGDPIGSLVSTGIDIAETGANLGITIKEYKDGKISAQDLTTSAVSSGLSITLSSLSFAKGIKTVGQTAKQASAVSSGLENAGKSTGDLVKNFDGSVTQLTQAGKHLKTVQNTLTIASTGLNVASQAADTVIEGIADNMQMQEEQDGIVKYAEVDRNSGQGYVAQTLSEKGNCFLNHEWFASENEIIMLLWKN